LKNNEKIINSKSITANIEKKTVAPALNSQKAFNLKKRKGLVERNAGPKWYGLKETVVTPEVRAHLKMLSMNLT